MSDEDKVKLAEVDARCQSNTHQIKDIKNDIADIRSEQKAIYDISMNIQLMAQSMGTMGRDIAEVQTDIKEVRTDVGGVKDKITVLENKPAQEIYKKNDAIKDAIRLVFALGIVTYLLSQILPAVNW